jgi:hypothetical protein
MPSEFKKLQNGPPPYLDLLHTIFDDVAVDGSTAYVPGQVDLEEQEEEDEDDDRFDLDHSPVSSGSRKRASSSSTSATSPAKKSKSPMVRIFRNLLAQQKEQQDLKLSFMARQAEERRKFIQEKEQQQASDLERIRQLALEAGVQCGSPEYLSIGFLTDDRNMKGLFLACNTPESRLQFIKGYMKIMNMD